MIMWHISNPFPDKAAAMNERKDKDTDYWELEFDRLRRKVSRELKENKPCIQFVVWSGSLDADEISALLEVQPDTLTRKGEFYTPGTGPPHQRADETTWVLSSSDHLDSHHPTAHLDWLLSCLFGKTPAIRVLQNTADTQLLIELNCALGPASGYVFLEPEFLHQLAQLRTTVQICFWRD